MIKGVEVLFWMLGAVAVEDSYDIQFRRFEGDLNVGIRARLRREKKYEDTGKS